MAPLLHSGVRMNKELKILDGVGYYKKQGDKTYTVICLMNPTSKYFVGNKYNTLEDAKQAFIQKQEYWNNKNNEEGFRTFNYQEHINKNEEE